MLNPTPQQQNTARLLDLLTRIEGHLRSIRDSMTFFVVLAVLAIVVQGCTALLNIR